MVYPFPLELMNGPKGTANPVGKAARSLMRPRPAARGTDARLVGVGGSAVIVGVGVVVNKRKIDSGLSRFTSKEDIFGLDLILSISSSILIPSGTFG